MAEHKDTENSTKVYGAREWDSPESLNLIRKAFGMPKAAAPR